MPAACQILRTKENQMSEHDQIIMVCTGCGHAKHRRRLECKVRRCRSFCKRCNKLQEWVVEDDAVEGTQKRD